MSYSDQCTCSRCGYSGYTAHPTLDGKPICKGCLSRHRYPRWPRGKYNGQRIIGFSVKAKLDITVWRWLPMIRWNKAARCFHWLCFYTWFDAEYADEMFIK